MNEAQCIHVAELLPWAVRGTLADDEVRLVEAHLASCGRCRAEREEVRAMFRLTGGHLPAEVIADLACDLPSEGWPRRTIDEHLALCSECREDLALAGGENLVAGSTGSASASWRGWRPLALAASLVACVGVTALWWQARPEPARLGQVALVEPVAESYLVRGELGDVATLDPGRPATVVLATDLLLDAAEYRVRLLSSAGEPLHEIAGVRPDASGLVAVHVPADLLPPGEASLVLEAETPGGWETLETYHLRVGG